MYDIYLYLNLFIHLNFVFYQVLFPPPPP